MSVQAGKPISVEAPTAKHLSERHVCGAACGGPSQSLPLSPSVRFRSNTYQSLKNIQGKKNESIKSQDVGSSPHLFLRASLCD